MCLKSFTKSNKNRYQHLLLEIHFGVLSITYCLDVSADKTVSKTFDFFEISVNDEQDVIVVSTQSSS